MHGCAFCLNLFGYDFGQMLELFLKHDNEGFARQETLMRIGLVVLVGILARNIQKYVVIIACTLARVLFLDRHLQGKLSSLIDGVESLQDLTTPFMFTRIFLFSCVCQPRFCICLLATAFIAM